MARNPNKTFILAKVETIAGTDASPASTDAIQISDAKFDIEYKNVERNLRRPTMGHGGSLSGSRHVKIDFTCELSTSGIAGTAPPWGKLLLACAFAEVVTAGSLVEYTPVSDGLKTLTIKYYLDGVKRIALGCMGSVTFNEPVDDRPTLQFSFIGTDGGVSADPAPTTDFTAWKLPEVVNNVNSGKLTLGGIYATGAVTGGTEYCSQGITLNMSNDTKYQALLGCAGATIGDRKPAGSFAIEVTAAQEAAMKAEIDASTPTSVSLLHGSAAGKQILIYIPRAMRLNFADAPTDGILLKSSDFNAEPVTGNDEVRIVVL